MIQRCLMSFFRWWIRQLAGLASARLLPLYVETGEAAVLEIADDAFALHVRCRGVLTRVAEGALGDLRTALASVADLPLLRVLRIPPPQLLRKRVSLPLAVRRDLRTVLAFEIDRETPFEQAEVYWNYCLADQVAKDRLEVDLIVIPRRAGNALAETARAYGFAPAALEAVHDGRSPTLLWLETPNLLRYFRLSPGIRPYMAAIYGAAAALLVVPFAVQQGRLFLADRTIAALESQAHAASALNAAANRRMAALTFMGRTHHGDSALQILALATRALPDDSYLTAFSVHDGHVTMAGSSGAAARLIGALATSRAFRDPVFDSAVLQGEGDDLERFTISARLAGAAGMP
jgi:general secretion pathway protein L